MLEKPTTRKNTVQPIAEPALDKFEIHEARAAGKLDLTDLDLNERAFLGTCQDIYRNSRGTATPFENFVTTIVRWTTWGNPPTPEDVAEEIKTELQEDFNLTLHSVKRFMQNYPDLTSSFRDGAGAPPEPPAADETTEPATKQPAKARGARKPRKKVVRAAA